MIKVLAVQETDICGVIKAHEQYAAISSKISDRMNYIIRHCVEAVGGKVNWWDWQNGGDGGDRAPGDFMSSYSRSDPDALTITGEWTHGDKMTFINKNGDEWELEYGELPVRWLYEDFEEEYANGLKLYREKQDQEKIKTKANKIKQEREKKALITAAASKLTKEERKALGIK